MREETIVIATLAVNPNLILVTNLKGKLQTPQFNQAYNWLHDKVTSGADVSDIGLFWAMYCQNNQIGFHSGSGFVDAVTWALNSVPPTHRTPSSLPNIVAHLDRQHDREMLRQIGSSLLEISDEDDPDSKRIEMISKLATVSTSDAKLVDIDNALDKYEKRQLDRAMGILPPHIKLLPNVDEHLRGGLFGDRYTLLSGRPGMGKTTVACAIANKALEQNWAVHISSLEMTSVDLLEIMVENAINKGTRDSVSKQIAYTKHKELLRRRLSMSDSGGQNVGDIFSHVLSAQARQMNDGAVGMLLLVDYIQLLDATGTYNARHLEVASVSKAFVTLKKILSENGPAHIMVLAQLNRNVEERQNKKPVMADLKDSGSLEQDADAIFLLYRDYYYNREVPPEEQHNLEVIIDKNRFGTVGSVETKIDLATKQWYNEVSPQDNNEYLTDDPAMFGDT